MSAAEQTPVTDWTTDFDHADPAWTNDPFPIWENLRDKCPVAHTERYGGTWLPVTHEHVSAVAYDTEHFTSRMPIVSNTKPGPNDAQAPVGGAPPITSDPPFHNLARRALLPPFAPKNVATLEPSTRDLCRSLLDEMGDADVVDAAKQYAQHIPVTVIADMLGFPREDAALFRTFVHNTLENIDASDEERFAYFAELDAYMMKQVNDHVANPRDDLTTYLLGLEIDGRKLEPVDVVGSLILILVAGIDTTWSAIGSSLWHLAQHPDDLARMASEPGIWPTAIEELLRAYAPVTMARLVAKDVELGGRLLREGDWVLLPFPAANRDPAEFERADEVVLDRAVNRHAAFGLGIHRCLGSNLARLELQVALEEFVARFPSFELADPAAVTWSRGQVRGPRTLPVRILARA